MNILVLSDFFPPYKNAGAENIAMQLCAGFKKSGHNVFVITADPRTPKEKEKKYTINHINVLAIGYKYNENFFGYLGVRNTYFTNRIKQFLLQNKVDFVHAHNVHKYISYSVFSLIKDLKIPVIHTVHDALCVDYGKYAQGIKNNKNILSVNFKANKFQIFLKNWKRYNPFREILIRRYLSDVKKIVCVSSELQNLLKHNNIHNTTVIRNGIESEPKLSKNDLISYKKEIGLNTDDKVILFAGRLSKEKGLMVVLEIITLLNEIDKKFKLIIVGGKLNLKKSEYPGVINFSWANKQQIRKLYSVADLSMVPSLYLDPFPTTTIESLSFGVPVIVSVFSGSKEIIKDKYNGYVVNPFDIESLLDKIIHLFNNRALLDQMKLNAYETYKSSLSLDIAVEHYLNLFDSVMANEKNI